MEVRGGWWIAVLVLVAVALPAAATAGQPPASGLRATTLPAQASEDPRPGDFFWEFRRSGPLADERVLFAFALLLDGEAVIAEAPAAAGRRLFYGDEQVRAFLAEAPPEDAPLLLEAAGVAPPGEPPQLREVRRCRLWTPAAADDAPRVAVATALGDQLALVLGSLGVSAQPCELTANSDDADLFVWEFGQDLHVNAAPPQFEAASFLEILVERPGLQPGAGAGGAPLPPATGSGGLLRASDRDGERWPVIALAATAALLAAGVWRGRVSG